MSSLLWRILGLVPAVVLVLVTGCANIQQPLNTLSGKPEVVLSKTTPKAVQGDLTNIALTWGYTVKSVNDFSVVYEKRDESIGAALLLGSRYDSTPAWRLTFNFAPIADNVRVVANMQAITNPGSAFERSMDMSSGTKDAATIQQVLNTLKGRYEATAGGAGRGKIGIGVNDGGEITVFMHGSPAEAAGLKVGDKIVDIDGAPFVNNAEAVRRITGMPGTTVTVGVVRNGERKDFIVARSNP